MDISALMIKMVIFAALISIGYFCARGGYLGKDFAKSASTLLLNVFLVASIINSVLGKRPELSGAGFGKAMFMLSLSMVVIYIVGFLAVLIFFRGRYNSPQIEILISVVNSLFVGMPICASIYGSEAVFYFGMSCVPFNLILYSYGIWRLKRGKGKVVFMDMITIPLAASVAALIIFLADPPVPGIVSELFGTVSGGTIPLSMIVIGATLGSVKLSDAFREKSAYIICVFRLVLTPVIVFFLCRLFNCSEALTLCCTVMAGCPSGVVDTPLSISYGYDPTYSSEVIMVTTVLSIVTIPAMISLLF